MHDLYSNKPGDVNTSARQSHCQSEVTAGQQISISLGFEEYVGRISTGGGGMCGGGGGGGGSYKSHLLISNHLFC